jgi:hypothetical protein
VSKPRAPDVGLSGGWTYTAEEIAAAKREASESPVAPAGAGGGSPASAKTVPSAPGAAQSATLQASLVRPDASAALPGIFRQAAESDAGLHAVVQVLAGLGPRVQDLETRVQALGGLSTAIASVVHHAQVELEPRVQALEASLAMVAQSQGATATEFRALHTDTAMDLDTLMRRTKELDIRIGTGVANGAVLAKRVQELEQAPGGVAMVATLQEQVQTLQLVLSTLIVRLKKHAVLADILRDLKLG